MAKRSTPVQRETQPLTSDQMRRGIELLERRIRDVEEFDFNGMRERGNPELSALQTSIYESLAKVFGHDTPEYDRYAGGAHFDYGPITISRYGSQTDFRPYVLKSRDRVLAYLRQAIKSLREDLEMAAPQAAIAVASPVSSEFSKEVFLVHGQDGQAKAEVTRFLEKAGVSVTILHEQPNEGRTIIEKFEKHGGAAGFAVILLTPDDVGGPADGSSAQRPRARQNVIGEMFWFAGTLGRKRVCALMKGNIEIPSDISGVVYTDMDARGAWKAELLRELSAAGHEIDWPRAMA